MKIFSDAKSLVTKIPDKKILIASVAGVLLLAAVAGVVYVTLIDTKELRYKTQAKLRAALPQTAADELHTRGQALRAPLSCQDLAGWTKKKMRVTCTGTTTAKKSVQVIGAGEDESQEQNFTILVDGRPMVQNRDCLGADCRKED